MSNNLIPASRDTALSPERTLAIMRHYGVSLPVWDRDGQPHYPTWGALSDALRK